MINLLASLLLWTLTHSTTITALALAFLVGSVWGMWLEFSSHDHDKKAAKRWNA